MVKSNTHHITTFQKEALFVNCVYKMVVLAQILPLLQ